MLTPAEIAAPRAERYRRTAALRVQTEEEARAFVAEVGFCHFWPIQGVETPNLFEAIAGRARAVPNAHNDPDLSKCWGWKDHALDKRWWYYGKLLRKRATMVSLDWLPAFYAASENYGDLLDYLAEYDAGQLTAEAKQVYEALLEHGPLDTIRLRREAHLSAESAKSRFDRALTELQAGLKVVPIGVAEAGAWNYAFIYELFQRYYPDVPGVARDIRRSVAQQTLIRRYLGNVVAADRGMVRKVFHVMKWTPREFEEAIAALLAQGAVEEMAVPGMARAQLVALPLA